MKEASSLEKLPIKDQITIHCQAFEAELSRELTPELARTYLSSLKAKIGNAESLGEFCKRGVDLYLWVGKEIYGPLTAGYTSWMLSKCRKIDYKGKVFFALRDATPLYETARVTWEGKELLAIPIYVNRPLFDVEDEIAPEIAMDNERFRLLKGYLAQEGVFENRKVVLCDSGCWGTVVRVLKEKYLQDKEFYPLFFYSHNPNIPGYLNWLAEFAGVPDRVLETINDSLECLFPQSVKRPLALFEENGAIKMVLESNSLLSRIWGEASLEGVRQAAEMLKEGHLTLETQIENLKRLHDLYKEAKTSGAWMGVLPQNTPTWSQGEAFLASWPKDLLP